MSVHNHGAVPPLFEPDNEIWVAKSVPVSGDGKYHTPFKTIAEGDAAVPPSGLLHISADDYTGETLDPAKDYFVDAPGVILDSISYANGTLQGWVGKSYFGRLTIDVYPLLDAIDSHKCLEFAQAIRP